MTLEQLQHLRDNPPARDDRVDIKTIYIDPNLSAVQRAEQYLQQVKNPYAFRVGDIAVNVAFSPNGKPLKETVISYLIALKNNA